MCRKDSPKCLFTCRLYDYQTFRMHFDYPSHYSLPTRSSNTLHSAGLIPLYLPGSACRETPSPTFADRIHQCHSLDIHQCHSLDSDSPTSHASQGFRRRMWDQHTRFIFFGHSMYFVACIGHHRKHSASRGIAYTQGTCGGGGIPNVRDTFTL